MAVMLFSKWIPKFLSKNFIQYPPCIPNIPPTSKATSEVYRCEVARGYCGQIISFFDLLALESLWWGIALSECASYSTSLCVMWSASGLDSHQVRWNHTIFKVGVRAVQGGRAYNCCFHDVTCLQSSRVVWWRFSKKLLECGLKSW